MVKMKTGKFYSWEIIDSNTAIKTCDKSFFDYRGTGIPHDIAWFFNAENMLPSKRTIHLVFGGKTYCADIICLERKVKPIIQLLWHADLGKELIKMKKPAERDYTGFAQFIRRHEGEYEIDFVITKASELSAEVEKKNLLDILDNLINKMSEQETHYLAVYTEALDIDEAEKMITEQQWATYCVRSIKKWNKQLIQMRNEVTASEIFIKSEMPPESQKIKELTSVPEVSYKMKIGQYVQERMRLLAEGEACFTNDEFEQMLDEEWSNRTLHLSKALIKLYNPSVTVKEQIVDIGGNNRYWAQVFTLNNCMVFICSQWYFNNKVFFDNWIAPIAMRAGIELPERIVIVDAAGNKQNESNIKTTKEVQQIKIGKYVQKKILELETTGVVFEQDYLELMLSLEWSRETFKFGFPFMKMVNTKLPHKVQITDVNKKNRYWKRPFKFGDVQVFICNEWHENSRKLFEKWLLEVPKHTTKFRDEILTDTKAKNVVKLTIADYKIK